MLSSSTDCVCVCVCVCGWSRSRRDWSRCRRSTRTVIHTLRLQDALFSWATHPTWSAPACERVSATSHSTEWYGHTETLFKLHYVSANNICLGLPLSVLFILNEKNLLMSSYFGVSVGRCDSVHSRRDWGRLYQMFSTHLPRWVQSKRQRATTARH